MSSSKRWGIWWLGVGKSHEGEGWVLDAPDSPFKADMKREANKVLTSDFFYPKDYEVREYK